MKNILIVSTILLIANSIIAGNTWKQEMKEAANKIKLAEDQWPDYGVRAANAQTGPVVKHWIKAFDAANQLLMKQLVDDDMVASKCDFSDEPDTSKPNYINNLFKSLSSTLLSNSRKAMQSKKLSDEKRWKLQLQTSAAYQLLSNASKYWDATILNNGKGVKPLSGYKGQKRAFRPINGSINAALGGLLNEWPVKVDDVNLDQIDFDSNKMSTSGNWQSILGIMAFGFVMGFAYNYSKRESVVKRYEISENVGLTA